MATLKRPLSRIPTRSNQGTETPPIILPLLEASRMPRDPKRQVIWKDRRGVRCAKRFEVKALLAASAPMLDDGWIAPRLALRLLQRTVQLSGVASCADPNDDISEWGDDDAIIVYNTTQNANSASA